MSVQRQPSHKSWAYWALLAIGLILGIIVFAVPDSPGRVAVASVAVVSALSSFFLLAFRTD